MKRRALQIELFRGYVPTKKKRGEDNDDDSTAQQLPQATARNRGHTAGT